MSVCQTSKNVEFLEFNMTDGFALIRYNGRRCYNLLLRAWFIVSASGVITLVL